MVGKMAGKKDCSSVVLMAAAMVEMKAESLVLWMAYLMVDEMDSGKGI